MTCPQLNHEQIPLSCPNCGMTYGFYMQVGEAVAVLLGFDLVQSINSRVCFVCGFRFSNIVMPKQWDKFKRRYYERLDNES